MCEIVGRCQQSQCHPTASRMSTGCHFGPVFHHSVFYCEQMLMLIQCHPVTHQSFLISSVSSYAKLLVESPYLCLIKTNNILLTIVCQCHSLVIVLSPPCSTFLNICITKHILFLIQQNTLTEYWTKDSLFANLRTLDHEVLC